MIEWQIVRPIPIPTLLGREHRVENIAVFSRIDAAPGIFNFDMKNVRLPDAGSYAQGSRVGRLHRLDGINDQIQYDLL